VAARQTLFLAPAEKQSRLVVSSTKFRPAFFLCAPRLAAYAPAVKNRAVFLDRDGTLIEEKEYLHRPEAVVIFPGAVAALKKLQDAGFLLLLVTNQSGVGRGYYTLADVDRVHAHLAQELARDGVRLAKIYLAPEAPDQPSRGRKPSPQFLLDARDEFGLDLAQCWMVGDKLIDLECGWNAGVKESILVRTGYGAEVEKQFQEKITRAVVVDGLPQAAERIVQGARRGG
jgi:D-glycero-D-manno-heptose 1,7-bisphosphate phosphatase